jgi:hypothetical protein
MKTTILTFSNSNMARSSGQWTFFLEEEKAGSYTLSCEQVVIDGGEAMVMNPLLGLDAVPISIPR